MIKFTKEIQFFDDSMTEASLVKDCDDIISLCTNGSFHFENKKEVQVFIDALKEVAGIED